jgi:hypothetical protein
VQDTARTEPVAELRKVLLARIVGLLRILLGVEVVQVAEELVETVQRGQELVAVAQVVLAELAGRVPVVLEQFGDRRVLRLQAHRCPRHATFVNPVRNPLCPVMNDARPAVQDCSPYESVNRMPSSAMRSMLGVR